MPSPSPRLAASLPRARRTSTSCAGLAGLAALASLLVVSPVACGPRHPLSHVRTARGPSATTRDGAASAADPSAANPAPASPGDASLDRARDRCVAEINRFRASIGVAPVQRWRSTEACTDDEARRDGVSQQAHGAFGTCQEWEQCECPGWDGPAETLVVSCLQAMWDEGPGGGHHDAMANPENRFVSCGFHDAADGSVWAIQNYGSGR